jgi:tetratricopeptide (TPR) repeat protein
LPFRLLTISDRSIFGGGRLSDEGVRRRFSFLSFSRLGVMKLSSSFQTMARVDPPSERFRHSRRRLRRTLGIVLLVGFAAMVMTLAVWYGTRFDMTGAARAAYARHQYRNALRAAQDHLKFFPHNRHASLLAARCLTRLGQSREAEVHYQRAAALDHEDMQARAVGLLQADQPKKALVVYQDILKRWPENALALKRSAAVRMGMKQWPEVLELSARLVAVLGEEVAGRTLEGIAYHELKHYPQAISASSRVLELDPDLKTMLLPRTLFWNNLALDLMALGRTEEARAFLTRALAGSDDAGLKELLGTTYFQQGDLDQAEQCWHEAVSLDPKNADAWLDLGRLAMSRRNWKQAAEFLTRAADLSIDAVEPLYNLSLAHQMMGNKTEADRFRRLADEKRRSSPQRTGGMGESVDSGLSQSGAHHPIQAPVR